MTLPFAALGALIAALVETSVLPEMQIAGAKPDLVFLFAIAATMLIGVEDGLVWAFLGGLMLDMLVPARPLGATTLSLLLMVGAAALAVRVIGAGRLRAIAATLLLTWPFHLLILLVLLAAEGVTLRTFEPRIVLVASLLNVVLVVPVAIAFAAVGARLRGSERSEW